MASLSALLFTSPLFAVFLLFLTSGNWSSLGSVLRRYYQEVRVHYQAQGGEVVLFNMAMEAWLGVATLNASIVTAILSWGSVKRMATWAGLT
jgi:hypothetical protein